MYKTSNEFIEKLVTKTPGEIEFHQAVKEVVHSIWDHVQENPEYLHANILDRIVEPERTVSETDTEVPQEENNSPTSVLREIQDNARPGGEVVCTY